MKRVFRILPLAMALGAISALAAAPSGDRTAARQGNADSSALSRSSITAPAFVRFSLASMATHAMPADLGVVHHLPSSGLIFESPCCCLTPPIATRPLLGAATPRAPAA